MKLKTGDILLVNTNSWIGKTIAWFQGNSYHHAGIIMRDGDNVWVFEAIETGMAFTEFSEYQRNKKNKGYELLILRPKSDIWSSVSDYHFRQFCLPLTQIRYEFKNLLGFQAIRYLSEKLFGLNIWIGRSSKKSKRAFICSELVMFIYNIYHGFFEDNWHKGSPNDIYNHNYFNHIKI